MGRVAALVEVLVAFVVVHVSYRSFKHFTELGRLEGGAGLNFSTGSAMILFTVLVLLLFKRSFNEYGLTLSGWRYSLNVGLLWGLLTVAGGAMIVRIDPIHFDTGRPPDRTGALVFTVGELAAVFLLLWFLMRERTLPRRIPASISLFGLVMLLMLPLALSWYSSRPSLNVLLTVLWLFFGAGFGEEIFFEVGFSHESIRPLGVRFASWGSISGLGYSCHRSCSGSSMS